MAAVSIVGVTVFQEQAPDDFDTFSRAFISMFRITIGSVDWFFDQFPTVRPDGTVNWRASLFLITYVILINWFFFQVSIAVLLENFQAASKAMRLRRKADLDKKRKANALSNPLSPLLQRLSQDFVDEADLTKRIRQLFKASASCHPTPRTARAVESPRRRASCAFARAYARAARPRADPRTSARMPRRAEAPSQTRGWGPMGLIPER